MTQQRVLITGGGNGIGLACVEKFLDAGWHVYAHYHHSKKELEGLARQFPGKLECVQADFADRRKLRNFLKSLDRIQTDVLINNAAVYDLSKKKSDRLQAIHDVLAVNVVAPTLITEKVFAKMKKNKKGSIVNISTIAARYGSSADSIFYGISKRGLEALTRTLAREGAAFGISVNTVRPGAIDTGFHRKIGRSEKDMQARQSKIPMGRLGTPQEVAELIFHLGAVHSFATNQTITIAGGD